jgi:hypothetical protein
MSLTKKQWERATALIKECQDKEIINGSREQISENLYLLQKLINEGYELTDDNGNPLREKQNDGGVSNGKL